MERICISDNQYLGILRQDPEQKAKCQVFRCKIRPILPYDFVRKAFLFGLGQEFKQPLTQGELQVEILIPEEVPNDPNGATAMMKIETLEGDHFLKEIWEKYPGKAFLSWHVTGFGGRSLPAFGKYGTNNWRAEGVELNRAREMKTDANGFTFFPQIYQAMKEIHLLPSSINALRNKEALQGFISIFLEIKKSADMITLEKEYFTKMGTMLEESIDTDLTLVTQDEGTPVKCHRVILSMGSAKLGNLLKMEEGSTVDIMKHQSAECVKAFLAYLYYVDTTKVFGSPEMALEVLEAALDFEVPELVSRIYNYFNARENCDITLRQAVKLFAIVKMHQPSFIYNVTGEGSQDNESEVENGGNREDDDDNNGRAESLGNEDGGRKRNAESGDDDDLNAKRICYRSGDGLNSNPESLTGTNENTDTDGEDNQDERIASNFILARFATMSRGDIHRGLCMNYLDRLEKRAVTLIKPFLEKNRIEVTMAAIKCIGYVRVKKICLAFISAILKI